MTDRLRAAAQAALDVLNTEVLATHACDKIEKILRAALDETDVPEAGCGSTEPVAWIESPGRLRMNPLHKMKFPSPLLDWKIALYPHPPRREWQSLTDEEVRNLWEFPPDQSWIESVHTAIRRAEAALKEKNA